MSVSIHSSESFEEGFLSIATTKEKWRFISKEMIKCVFKNTRTFNSPNSDFQLNTYNSILLLWSHISPLNIVSGVSRHSRRNHFTCHLGLWCTEKNAELRNICIWESSSQNRNNILYELKVLTLATKLRYNFSYNGEEGNRLQRLNRFLSRPDKMIFLVIDEIFIHWKSDSEIFLCVLQSSGNMFSVDIAVAEESIPNTNLLLLTVNTNFQPGNNAGLSIVQHSLPSHVISLRLILVTEKM